MKILGLVVAALLMIGCIPPSQYEVAYVEPVPVVWLYMSWGSDWQYMPVYYYRDMYYPVYYYHGSYYPRYSYPLHPREIRRSRPERGYVFRQHESPQTIQPRARIQERQQPAPRYTPQDRRATPQATPRRTAPAPQVTPRRSAPAPRQSPPARSTPPSRRRG